MTQPTRASPALPPGHRLIRDLTRAGSVERVLRTEAQGRALVVRISPRTASRETLAELAVLAAVEHAGLARLVGFGALNDGAELWVAREWLAGVDLGAWSRERSPEEIGRAIASLCPALQHLHERGFVHGDLKAANVIACDDGRFVITDFGLATRAQADAVDVAGTHFGIAPERLLGLRIDARADLFALGVLLHELTVRERSSARDFYGRFPAFDFFAATDTRRDALPEWARDVVERLVERNPAARPASAEEVGRTLAGRLGMTHLSRASTAIPRVPVELGRAQWLARWQQNRSALEWISTANEDVHAVRDMLALRAALAGDAVAVLDLSRALGQVRDAKELDAWSLALVAEHAGAALLVSDARADAWSARALESLAKALEQGEARLASKLTVVSSAATAPGGGAWKTLVLQPISNDPLDEFVREQIAGDPDKLNELARLLADVAQGSTRRLEAALERLARDGALVGGEQRVRIAPSQLPRALALDELRDAEKLDGDARAFVAAQHVCGAGAAVHEVAALAKLDDVRLANALEAIRRAACGSLEQSDGVLRLRLAGAPPPTLVSPERWRELHARRSRQLAGTRAALAHAFAASAASSDALVLECERLRDAGCAELSLELCDAAARACADTARELGDELVAARALAWVALGQPERAREVAQSLVSGSPLAERVLGHVAILRHEPDAALAHFERARGGAGDDGSADLARTRLLYELQRDRDVLALVESMRARSATMPQRVWANALAVEAMSLFRTGEVERARALLASYVADARNAADATREAALLLNLSVVERRAGDLSSAISSLERARELYDAAGIVAGLAQAKAMLGAALRDAAQFARAGELLGEALAARERLGDAVGALAVRGMLGLTLADRGHARAAALELEHAAVELRKSQRSRDATFLEARADEMRARLNLAPLGRQAQSETERLTEGDPRTLASRARSALLRGRVDDARDFALRAAQLAASLRLSSLHADAAFVLACAEGEAPELEDGATTLIEHDVRVFQLLSHAPFDVAAARALAQELAATGRDDRAARLWLALFARTPAGEPREVASNELDRAFTRCAAGCSQIEVAALRRTLLGVPDPWPEDALEWERRQKSPEEDEMEVVRLLEINRRLVAQEDLRTLLGTIVEQALFVSGAQRGFLILEKDGELEVDTALDSRRGGIDAPDVEVSGSVLRDALAKMRAVRVSNAVDDPLLGSAPSVISLDLRSILCVPFEVERGLRGVIYVDHRLREGAFDARAERMLALLADQAALAIGQVRRVDEIRRLNRELSKQMARKESDLRTANAALRKASLPAPAAGLVGDAPVMRAVRELIERAAQTKLAVLVTGPSGSGKELAARALHELGPRADGAFVGENCAALPETLIEAELFGARRGAFTGAERDREGLFERAHGGTLFLDEIGELPLELQAKLLRVLETSQLRRLGDDKLRTVDFRLVAATNRDLAQEVRDGRFRSDLYYRLNGLAIEMPALAAHAEDIPALVDHWVRLNAPPGGEPRKIAPAVVTALCRRAWPGNVRELFNELARLSVLSEGEIGDPSLVRSAEHASVPVATPGGAVLPFEELERRAILHALEVAGGDKRKAAELLGISRAKVYQRLKDWGLTGGE